MDIVNLGWVDIGMLAVLLMSVVIGAVRGFVFELLSLAGWVAAWIAAQWFGAELAQHLPIGVPGSPLNLGLGYALTFIGALVLWTLAAKFIRMLIHATPLSLIDRVLGAAFGLVRGGVLLLLVTLAIGLTPFEKSPAWRQSQGAVWLNAVLQAIKPLWPGPVTPARQA
jgi:membrane protein required for colicin V production